MTTHLPSRPSSSSIGLAENENGGGDEASDMRKVVVRVTEEVHTLRTSFDNFQRDHAQDERKRSGRETDINASIKTHSGILDRMATAVATLESKFDKFIAREEEREARLVLEFSRVAREIATTAAAQEETQQVVEVHDRLLSRKNVGMGLGGGALTLGGKIAYDYGRLKGWW